MHGVFLSSGGHWILKAILWVLGCFLFFKILLHSALPRPHPVCEWLSVNFFQEAAEFRAHD